jgi:uncharacterized protein (TIGR00369 family)
MINNPQDAKNVDLDDKLFREIINKNIQTNLHRFLDMNIVYLEKGLARMKMKVKEEFINPNNVCHGGISFSLLDTAMGMSIRTFGKEITTIEMNLNYLYPANENDILMAIGRVIKNGSRIVVCEGELYNQDNKLLAKSRGSFYVLGKIL